MMKIYSTHLPSLSCAKEDSKLDMWAADNTDELDPRPIAQRPSRELANRIHKAATLRYVTRTKIR